MLDTLPAIVNSKPGIFIKNINNQDIHWRAFLNPLSNGLWIMLIIFAIVISCTLTATEQFFGLITQRLWIPNFSKNLWLAIKANFGGKPSTQPKATANQIIVFICLLSGSITWIAYRASLTSELSVVNIEKPFDSLESLLTSNYK